MATKPPFATTSVKQAVLGLVHPQQNETIASQNAAASQTQAEIGNLISQTEAKIRDYQTAKSAIETGASLDSQNLAYLISLPSP